VAGWLLLSGVLLWNPGCNSTDGKGVVKGTVTVDGNPLAEGVVRFVPIAGDAPTASADVTNGDFRASVPTGASRIEISAPKIVGTQKMYDSPKSPTVDIVEELLPAKYNVQSELRLDVKPGSQTAMFQLESQ